jgi:hypothetical protein
LEVTCCFAQSVASTRWAIQDELRIQTTQCDNCIIGTSEQRRAGAVGGAGRAAVTMVVSGLVHTLTPRLLPQPLSCSQ